MNLPASTFWDEATDTSELRWYGHVLKGSSEAAHAIMSALNDLELTRQRMERAEALVREVDGALYHYNMATTGRP